MLPNRVSVNLFAGSLIINIITIGYTTRVPSFSFTGFTLVINLAEIVNPCLQLVIFSLLTMDYDGFYWIGSKVFLPVLLFIDYHGCVPHLNGCLVDHAMLSLVPFELFNAGTSNSGISDKQFTSEMNNVHPTTRNTPVRSPYSTLFSTDTSFSSIRLSCHVISLPTCTIGADRPTRNKPST